MTQNLHFQEFVLILHQFLISAEISIFFQHRDEVKGELGDGARVGDIAKELGKRWKELTDVNKIIIIIL